MFHTIIKNKLKKTKIIFKGLSALMVTSILSGCFHNDDDEPASLKAEVNFILASVEGGSCSLLDPYSNMTTIGGASITSAGVAIFEDVAADTGLTVVECSGGTYIDEATGDTLTPGTLRSYVNITTSEFTATVSPLTEIAARVVEYYELAPEDYAGVLANVAISFGLRDVDLATVVPLDLNVDEADGTESGNYGLVLAALSQLQLDFEVDNAEFVMEEMFIGMANNGFFTSEDIRESYFYALDNMFDNPRIDPFLGSDEDLDKFFHDVVLSPIASQVEYVDADHPESQNLEALTTIDAFETSVFDLFGTQLSLQMDITLADEPCKVFDLQSITDTNTDSKYNLMFAECPAQAIGEANLVVKDADGRIENTTAITVVEPGSYDYGGSSTRNIKNPQSYANDIFARAAATGTSYVFGTVKAEAPAIDASVSPAHDYSTSKITQFIVKGVTVDLVDGANQIIASTVTGADGYYEFANAPESTSVSVVVKAEIKKIRETANTGPEYNFSVRDNTTTTTPRKLYQVATPYFTTAASPGSDNPKDILATVGFSNSGEALAGEQRQSAPFAILRLMKTASDQLETINPNVSMPTLNVYWSVKNLAANGDKALGQIDTSHYANQGLLPGLYILGKADSDTDEFDQGVIGHEFGHYLQAQLSFADNPGGGHSGDEYKDASLAYGEGYGSAIGGLLSGSKYYCDVSGSAQTGGFCWDLTNKSLTSIHGFYSEVSILTLMYAIGNIEGKGLGKFFDAVTKMKTGMHSATIFTFLHHYLAENPDVSGQVATLMTEHNIKSSSPFGVLSATAALDPKLAASINKGDAATGADDLEKLYIELVLDSVEAPFANEKPALLTPNSTPFCANRNLPGANKHNGLGMRRRFTFTANFTGDMLVRAKNKLNQTLSDQIAFFKLRSEGGNELPFYGYNGVDGSDYYGVAQVESGKKYSLVLNMAKPEAILKGSQCGYKVELARPGF